MSQREWNNEPKQRWLVTTVEDRIARHIYETVEIDQHPVEYLNELDESGIHASLVMALKLHPEDPGLER